MGFPYSGYKPLPAAEYDLEIKEAVEAESKKGYPMVKLKLSVIDGLNHNGKSINHFVTFIPDGLPGASIALKFLKTIGEPYTGEFDVEPSRWVGKRIRAKVGIEEYNGEEKNVIKFVKPYEGHTVGAKEEAKEEGVPF